MRRRMLVPAALVTLCGCATLAEQGARRRVVVESAHGFIYERPLAVVWPRLRQLVRARGYRLPDRPGGSGTFVTEEKKLARTVEQYEVVVDFVDDHQYRLQVTRIEEPIDPEAESRPVEPRSPGRSR